MTKHIFTIDDERSIRDAFVLALEDFADVEVHEAENGLLGVELAKEIVPDLVFIDLNMPVMNGVDAIKLIRELHPDVMIYVVTAFSKMFFDELEALTSQGIQFEIAAKPMSMEQIQTIVSTHLALPKAD